MFTSVSPLPSRDTLTMTLRFAWFHTPVWLSPVELDPV